MISKPIEIANGIKNGTVKEYCSSQITLYKKLITQGDTIAAPYRQMQLGISSSVTNYSGINFSNGQLIVDNRMHTTVEFEFSNKLRLNKIGYPGELPIVYQWDSKLLHPQSETQGNHTTLYNYKPMVGLNSKTDSKGVTIYYDYDVSGRLISIKDNNLNLIQSFEYKYKTIPQP
jgi:YD repeat-containing protein